LLCVRPSMLFHTFKVYSLTKCIFFNYIKLITSIAEMGIFRTFKMPVA